jgi:hypothetical protein
MGPDQRSNLRTHAMGSCHLSPFGVPFKASVLCSGGPTRSSQPDSINKGEMQPVTRLLPARDHPVAYMVHNSRVKVMDPGASRWMELDQGKPGSLGRFVHRGVSLNTLEGFADE